MTLMIDNYTVIGDADELVEFIYKYEKRFAPRFAKSDLTKEEIHKLFNLELENKDEQRN